MSMRNEAAIAPAPAPVLVPDETANADWLFWVTRVILGAGCIKVWGEDGWGGEIGGCGCWVLVGWKKLRERR